MITCTLLAMMGKVSADEVTVADVTVPQGGQATLNIGFLFNSDNTYTACQFDLSLPDGVTTLKDEEGAPVVAMGDALADHDITPKALASGDDRFVVASFSKTPFTASSGTMLTVTLCADRTLTVGDIFTATITGITFSTTDKVRVPFPDVTFNVTIGESRTILDETSTTMPVPEENANVRVKRTIKANEWSTLCLPFAMSEAQVKEAFGEDVELKDFVSWSSEEDGEGDIVSIEVGFDDISEIEANHPCLIRVSEAVNEFTVDGVDIEPEEEPTVQVGKKKAERGYLIGTYVAQTEVPENDLFISENLFWYSAGKTKMKAFRAYFEFADVLTNVEDGEYANVRFVFGGEATGVKGVREGIADRTMPEGVYTLQGVKVEGTKALPKGVYIVNGKKVRIDN
ncbi:MAG: hypothetical protein IKQ62_09825 [Bacteroidaceae bacterium]|nr:hypothetical protein [Bacteroidaceae bacterium]